MRRFLFLLLLVVSGPAIAADISFGPGTGGSLSYTLSPDWSTVVIESAPPGSTSWTASSTVNGNTSQTSMINGTVKRGEAFMSGSGSASYGPTSPYYGFVHSTYEAYFLSFSSVDATLSGTLCCSDYYGPYGGAFVQLHEWDVSTETLGDLVYEAYSEGNGSTEFSYSGQLYGTAYRLLISAWGGNDQTPGGTSSSGSWDFSMIEDPIQLTMDVLPGDAANKIYPNKSGKVPVAVLSKPGFGVTQVDPATLKFGSAEASPADPVTIAEVDGLYGDDITTKFGVQESGIFCNDTEVELTGQTYSGDYVTAVDMIDASECETGGCHSY